MKLPAFLFVSLALTPIAYGQLAISELRVEGNSRLPSAGIIGASGLRAGSNIPKKDLDAAAQKLFDTGWFTGVNYRYAPRPGAAPAAYIVTFVVTEDRAKTGVVIDVPGYPEDQIWAELKISAPLVDRVIPDSDAASAYYAHAMEAVLAKSNRQGPIVMRPETDLKTGKLIALFQPAVLPKVAAIRFEGNHSIPSDVLNQAISRLTVGEDFSERTFRTVVTLNLTPLYEEKGLLTVAFPPLKFSTGADGAASVAIPIEEGRAWTLGKVEVTGDALPLGDMLKDARFPEGKLANWKQIQTGVEAMEKVLRRQGYLGVSSKIARSLHEDTGAVDVSIPVAKGQQSLFGSLQIIGLDADDQARAQATWSLKSGDPLDFYYVNADYSKSLKLTGGPKQIRVDLHPRPGTNIVDVAVAFTAVKP